MKRFIVSLLAESDLAEIHAFVAADRPRAADRLITRFFRAFETFASQPSMGEEREDLFGWLTNVLHKKLRDLLCGDWRWD